MAGGESSPPRGSPLPAALQTLAWFHDPIAFLGRSRRRHGPIFRSKLYPFGTLIFVSSPAAIKQVFTGDPDELRAGEGNGRREVFEPMLGTASLLLLDGREHLRHRKLMLPPFHGERMKSYARTMTEAAERSLAAWPVGEPFPLRPRMQEITLDVILKAVFGIRGEERVERARSLIARLLDMADRPTVIIPFLRNSVGRIRSARRFFALRDALDRLLYEEIAERRHESGAAERDDILSLLARERFEDGGGMTDKELRDELMTLLVAGHETTATALAWAFELLFRNPDVAAKLQNELAAGRDEYLQAAIKESMRIRPVIDFVGRKAKTTIKLAGYEIPPETMIAASIYMTQHDPELYPEPDAFRPERFLDNPPDTYSWLPFGGGVRRCLGASFATFEMSVVLRTILGQAVLGPASDQPEPVVRRHVTYVPKHGAMAILARRG